MHDVNKIQEGEHKIAIAPDGCEVKVFIPPSKETIRMARLFGPLVLPKSGQPGKAGKLFGQLIIAPFTQFTLFNFDLQVFLFQVFHVSIWARLSHALFMPTVVFFVAAFLAQFNVALLPFGETSLRFSGADLYVLLLSAWYFGLARREGFYLWWLISAPLTWAIGLGADTYYHAFALSADEAHWYAPTALICNPLLWMFVAANVIAVGHIPENVLPPRAFDCWRWRGIWDTLLDENRKLHSPLTLLSGLGVLLTQYVMGTLNEWWASPRLMPYSWLMLMFRLGYKAECYAEAKAHAEQALASGNPAMDFVGIGGGAYLNHEYVHTR